ncbi:MAG: DUF4921 family protein [Kineosporiaceae bacterium]|nr:DUF4921 family protein [Kineosporiaceae bacterium]
MSTSGPFFAPPKYLDQMADGTIKQINPFSGTEVWTVPGRGNRPLGIASPDPRPLRPEDDGRHCAFCTGRQLDTPPEKARLVRDGTGWHTLTGTTVETLHDTVAQFRRIPNLFEIISYDYWRANYGHTLGEAAQAHRDAYLATDAGRAHLLSLVDTRLRAAGTDPARLTEQERLAVADGFFGGGHDVIVARRHFVDGATHDTQLASSGRLTPEEHHAYTRFTVDSLRELYLANRYARYVAVFQNWLKPAGASFDHLHKQLVSIDERGVQAELELQRVRANPNLFNEAAVNYAGYHNLVVAENEHAIAIAGFGHRFPALEVFSKSARSQPWNHSPQEVRAMSDLIHACHAASGDDVPTNEEWHHKPPDVDVPMPWRVVIKWRVSTLAGFEGGTKIYLNTISPTSVRDRVVDRLFRLKDEGRIAPMRIAFECECAPNVLRYNPAVRRGAVDDPEF